MSRAVMIAGTNSGVGKTTAAMGIMAALTARGVSVQPFKVGPDYIDPSHHSAICGRPSRNLDPYIMGTEGVKKAFLNSLGSSISVIEGAMGLYDGLDASDVGSSAHVARILDVPVVLIINVRGMSLSAAAVVKGYLMMDPEVRIAGIILNHAGSQRHRRLIEEGLKFSGVDIPVIGAMPKNDELSIPHRHLGLHMAHEFTRDHEKLAEFVESHINMDALLEISSLSGGFSGPEDVPATPADVRIGIAMDSVFCFYYQDMLDHLKHLGAELVSFSPLSEEMPHLDGLILGGGYPELFPEELSAGRAKSGIKKAAMDDMPVYAECGGLMYLGRTLEVDGKRYEMSGVLDTESRMVQRFQALGYTEAEVVSDNHLALCGQIIRGHEFHYSVTDCPLDARFAYRMKRGKGIQDGQDGIMIHNTLASYMHTHPACAPMERFVEKCRAYSNR